MKTFFLCLDLLESFREIVRFVFELYEARKGHIYASFFFFNCDFKDLNDIINKIYHLIEFMIINNLILESI